MLISGTAGDTHHTKTQRLHGGASSVEPPPWSLLRGASSSPADPDRLRLQAAGCGRGALSPDYLPSVTGGGRLGVEFLPAGRGAAAVTSRDSAAGGCRGWRGAAGGQDERALFLFSP